MTKSFLHKCPECGVQSTVFLSENVKIEVIQEKKSPQKDNPVEQKKPHQCSLCNGEGKLLRNDLRLNDLIERFCSRDAKGNIYLPCLQCNSGILWG